MRNYSLGQHYTDSVVANTLAGLIGVRSPGTVIDLGVGEGSLLHGANYQWQNAQLHGIDIDQKNLDFVRAKIGKGTFGRADCLAKSLSPVINALISTADVVLCNPPFLEFAHLRENFFGRLDWQHTAEAKFFELSLQLLRPGGSLGIILPARYISGPSYWDFRKQLLEKCNVVSVTKLPPSTFKSAEVESYFIVLRKESPTADIKLQSLADKGHLSIAVRLSSVSAIERMDYDYYAKSQSWMHNAVPLSILLTEDICRGVASRGRFTSNDIFHTTSFKFYPEGKVNLRINEGVATKALAIKGDILIPRVGSRCLHYCALVESGEIVISDCIYRLRVSPEWRNYVFEFLKSPDGIAIRQLSAHGTCVKILGKQPLLDLPIPMISEKVRR
jgi:type I restriction enzyme M protein